MGDCILDARKSRFESKFTILKDLYRNRAETEYELEIACRVGWWTRLKVRISRETRMEMAKHDVVVISVVLVWLAEIPC